MRAPTMRWFQRILPRRGNGRRRASGECPAIQSVGGRRLLRWLKDLLPRRAVVRRRASRRIPAIYALEGRQLLSTFVFDPDGPGPLTPQDIDPSGRIGGFDFSV